MIARYGISIALGAGVTFGLLFIMQLLIATGRGALSEGSTFRAVDFVRVERDQVIETKKDKPEKPPEPDQQPDLPNPDRSNNFDNSLNVSMSSPTPPGATSRARSMPGSRRPASASSPRSASGSRASGRRHSTACTGSARSSTACVGS